MLSRDIGGNTLPAFSTLLILAKPELWWETKTAVAMWLSLELGPKISSDSDSFKTYWPKRNRLYPYLTRVKIRPFFEISQKQNSPASPIAEAKQEAQDEEI